MSNKVLIAQNGIKITETTTYPTAPSNGMIVYRSDLGGFYVYEAGAWAKLPISSSPSGGSSTGGADVLTISNNLLLTLTSQRVQRITATSANLNVFLPNATLLTTGGPIYFIKNDGLNAFSVRDFDGNLIAIVASKQSITMLCSDITTSAGKWSVGNDSYQSTALAEFLANSPSTTSPQNVLYSTDMAQLDATTFLISYPAPAPALNLRLQVVTVVGNVVTFGTAITATAGGVGDVTVTKLTSTTALICYGGFSTSALNAIVATVSGLTVTVGPEQVSGLGTNPTGYLRAESISPTQVLFTNKKQSASPYQARVLTVSGNTVTFGTPIETALPNAYNFADLVRLTPTTFLFTYNAITSASVLVATIISVSGVTPSFSSIFTVQSAGIQWNYIRCTALSPTKVLITGNSASTNASLIAFVDISGTTISNPVIGALEGVTGVSPFLILPCAMSATKIAFLYKNNANNNTCYLIANVDGSTLSVDIINNAYIVNSFGNFSVGTMIAPSSSKVVANWGVNSAPGITYVAVLERIDI